MVPALSYNIPGQIIAGLATIGALTIGAGMCWLLARFIPVKKPEQ